MKKYLLHIAALLLVSAPAFAADDGGTTSPFAFGAGARELALGGSDLAAVDPAMAPYWNPAQLVPVEKISLSGFHTRLYDSDVAYQYFGIAFPTLDWGTIGIGVFRLGIDNIERRDQSNMLTGYFEDNRMAYYFAYGRRVADFDIGLSVNVESQKLDAYSATSSPGVNLAIGRTFEFDGSRIGRLSLALIGRNLIRPGLELFDNKINYPYAADFSTTISLFPTGNRQHRVDISAAVNKTDFIDPKLSLGLEYSFDNTLFLRGGLRDSKLSLGGGLTYKMFSFDYALVDRDLGSLHLFSLSSTFGRSTSERRQARNAAREAQFNSSMNDRLESRYQSMVENLLNDGQTQMDAGKLAEAAASYEKALFLAQSNGGDTTDIARMVRYINTRIEKENNRLIYSQYVDSAKTRFETNDYLGAKYFANLARSIDSTGTEADYYINESNRKIDNMASHEEMIRQKLTAVDSLLGYGYVDKALVLVKSLKQFASEDDRIQSTLRKVEFEYWKNDALTSYNSGDYTESVRALDTALALYPGHVWCLNLKDKITRSQTVPEVSRPVVESQPTVNLSGEILKEAENNYKEAQHLFENGNLPKAIELWERIEKIAPNYQSVRQYLVKAYRFVGIELYGQNRLEESIKVWNKALALDPFNQELIDYIKRTERESKKLKELSYDNR